MKTAGIQWKWSLCWPRLECEIDLKWLFQFSTISCHGHCSCLSVGCNPGNIFLPSIIAPPSPSDKKATERSIFYCGKKSWYNFGRCRTIKTHRYKTSNFLRRFSSHHLCVLWRTTILLFSKGWSRKKTQDLGNGIDFPFIAIGFP